MEISKDKIEALKYVKNIFSFQSDYSTQCNGYSSLLGLIEAAEKEYSEEKEKLQERSDKIELLTAYSEYLEKDGYLDHDWRDDLVIDEFFKNK